MQTTSYTSKQHKRFPQLIPEFLKVFDMDFRQQSLPPLCKQLGPSTTGGASMGISKVGQFHSVRQFLDKAMNLHHPIDTLNPVPDSTQKAIFNILTKGPSEIASERIGTIKHILELDRKLQDEEKAFHKTLPSYMRRVLKGKKTILFKELLRETSYDDMEVCDFLQCGTQLFGHHSVPPYASFTSLEHLQLHDFDMVVSMAKLIKPCNSSDEVKMVLSTGEALRGRPHSSLKNPQWKARSLDLAKAYKQLAVHPNSRHLAVVGYQLPDGSCKYYVSNSLSFGATASVFGFLRVSRALWHIATVMLNIPGSCYFDDFPHYEVDQLCHSSQQAYETLLKILGWQFAEGEKNLPFNTSYNILGASIDLSSLQVGAIKVSNKQGRLEHISGLVNNLRQTMSFFDAAILRGHIVFASGFCLGRSLRPAMGAVDLALKLSADLRTSGVSDACGVLLDLLSRSGPRTVECRPGGPPLLVFTDSAFENGVATVGALIVDPELRKSMVYDGAIPEALVKKWQSSGSKQVIFTS